MSNDPFLPIDAPPARLRTFKEADVPELVAYRNDPETARFQDWPLPYTAEAATAMIRSQSAHDGPIDDDWFQIAIEVDGALAGDVAVGLAEGGRLAMIGYTLTPALRGRGIATVAAATVIDRLFERGVHRVSATLDPDNLASARLLERLGFRYEGRSVKAAFARGEWWDDDRYAILAEERAAWLGRSTAPAQSVRLVEVTEHNLTDVLALSTAPSQHRFVAPVGKSLAQILVGSTDEGVPIVPWYRAIEADGEIAGFVLVAHPMPHQPVPYLWRLLIDSRFQGRGVGSRVIELVVEVLRGQGHSAVELSYRSGPGSPAPFYAKLGFVPTGRVDRGENLARLDFDRFTRGQRASGMGDAG